ncbi:hypothetical protein BT69DRAFT_1282823 [Atractiella rhizophila]|nr:hypothetical protein BT69DRAFT_1282823 [Atractiella rhizophila]
MGRLSWEIDIEDETRRFYTIPTSPISFRPSSLPRTSLSLYCPSLSEGEDAIRYFVMSCRSSGTFPVSFFLLTHHLISADG